MVDIAGSELTPDDIDVLKHPLVGSVLLFTRNYRNPQQVAGLTAAIRAVRTPHLLIAVDHEGGRVQRFREGFTKLPPSRPLGRRFEEDRRDGLDLTRSIGWLMASELRHVGVDFSFAPCVDLDYGVSEIIGDRSFHRDPETVAALAAAYMSGMREAGMAATAKHFPGHGAVVADSHVALPVDRRDLVDMEGDIRPYRLLIENNLAGVMAAHVVYPAVDALPASLSRRWITDILRGDLGFHGCVFADDLSMAGAVAFGDVVQRARLAHGAGCDVLPICNDRAAVSTVLDRFKPGAADPASQARLVRMRGRGAAPVALTADPHWLETVQRILNLSAAPPLVLTEEQS
jgi:beta-N-acetylhexosaminidase